MKKDYVIITLLLVIAFAIFASGTVVGLLIAMKLSDANPAPVVTYPTGGAVLAALQDYRLSEDLPRFVVSDTLCDNIAERWQNYIKNDSHAGWEEFVAREYPPGFTASEIMVSGTTAQEMVQKWKDSPSHNLAIHNYSKICVYSDKGSTVAILSN